MHWLKNGNLLSVPGWRGAATAVGLKTSGDLDLALLVADGPRTAAGVFTRNRLPAAPVRLCKERLQATPRARAIVINAGIANAMTGPRGMEDARAMADEVEACCGGPALVLSTGVIGVPLPREIVLLGIGDLSGRLRSGAPMGRQVAAAMLTTDTRLKTAALQLTLPDSGEAPSQRVTVGGLAKGSGMIHPDMATMLCVVATDAPVGAPALQGILKRAVDASFHEITVDGDTSTNDTVLLLAGGGGGPELQEDDPRLPLLERGITEVMHALAREILRDGEGASRVMEIRVSGAPGRDEARQIAESVARSSLVKTALAGGDPNWGRILAAAANAGVPIDEGLLSLRLGGHEVFGGGQVRPEVEPAALEEAFARDEVLVELELGSGPGRARRFTTDLTQEYVRINAEYTT